MVEQLNELAQQKQTLIRLYDGNEINKETYEKEMNEIEKEIHNIIENKVNGTQEENIINETKTNTNNSECIKEQQECCGKCETPKRGRKQHKNSTNNLIIKTLMIKEIKNIDDAVEHIYKQHPELNPDKLLLQIRVVISSIKHQKGNRWKKYKWNKEEYLVEEK